MDYKYKYNKYKIKYLNLLQSGGNGNLLELTNFYQDIDNIWLDNNITNNILSHENVKKLMDEITNYNFVDYRIGSQIGYEKNEDHFIYEILENFNSELFNEKLNLGSQYICNYLNSMINDYIKNHKRDIIKFFINKYDFIMKYTNKDIKTLEDFIMDNTNKRINTLDDNIKKDMEKISEQSNNYIKKAFGTYVINDDVVGEKLKFAFITTKIMNQIITEKITEKLDISKTKDYTKDCITIKIPSQHGDDICNKLANYTFYCINLIEIIFKKKINRLKILLLNSDIKKTVPEDKIFTVEQINSAEFNPNNNTLSIFRSEEIYKLLIHELIHRVDNCKKNDDNFYKHFALINPGTFNETITETLACFINIILVSKYNNIDIKQVYKNELLFSLFQTSKILYIYGINNIDEFLDPSNPNKVQTTTSLVEYHIFKSVCLLNFGEFYEIYIQDGDIFNFIYNHMKNNLSYKKIIDDTIKKLATYNKESELYKTMRMTINELNI